MSRYRVTGHARLRFRDNQTWTRWLPIRPGIRRDSTSQTFSIRIVSHIWYVGWIRRVDEK